MEDGEKKDGRSRMEKIRIEEGGRKKEGRKE